MNMYDLLTGPLLWLTFAVTFLGLAWRVVWYLRGLDWRLDRVAYRPHFRFGMRGAVRSIFYWLLPFGSRSWRERPFFTVLFFAFHAGLLFTPVFLEAHNVMLSESLGIRLPGLPQGLADVLAWTAVVGGLFMALRRFAYPEVRILTTAYDYLLIVIATAPFVTGLVARYHLGDYAFWLPLHIASGEIWLLSLPFTKLNHVVMFFLSRGQLGMDYGIKRGGMKGTNLAW